MLPLQVKVGDEAPPEDSAAGPPELLSHRLIRETGQVKTMIWSALLLQRGANVVPCAPCVMQTFEGAPTFQFYPAFHWQLRRRVLTLFQQAARKVTFLPFSLSVIKCHTCCFLYSQCSRAKNYPGACESSHTWPEVDFSFDQRKDLASVLFNLGSVLKPAKWAKAFAVATITQFSTFPELNLISQVR